MRSRFERALAVIVALVPLAVACGPKKRPPEQVFEPAVAVLERAQAREVPSPVQARFQIKLRSKPLGVGGTTGGGLQVDRPGRARIEIFGPLGGSIVSLMADGTAFAAWFPKDRRHLLAPDAEALVRDATKGAIGLDELIGLLVGDVPFDAASLRGLGVVEQEGRVRATFEGPGGVGVTLDLDPATLTPARLVATGADGAELLRVDYEGWLPFVDHLLPAKVDLTVPSYDLTLSLRYQGWTRPEAMLPMDTAPPEGVISESLVEVIRASAQAMDAPPSP